MEFELGDVVLVPFRFTSQTASKKRPAVVVSNRAYNTGKPDVVVMAITSQLRVNSGLGEIEVGQWQTAGLLKPSAVKPVFATLDQSRAEVFDYIQISYTRHRAPASLTSPIPVH